MRRLLTMSIIISKEFLLAFLLYTHSAVILETAKRIKNKTESKQKKLPIVKQRTKEETIYTTTIIYY
jgi:hypothetical protein